MQDATMKLEVYSKLCDEKCDQERELIRKQEHDRKKYINKMTKLRDEMMSAPWLLLSDNHNNHINGINHNGKNHNKMNDNDHNKLHKQLLKTYQAIRAERRTFLPMQRKWAKLIAQHQIYKNDEKAFNMIRTKLQNMRKYEKEYKLKMFDELKSMLTGVNIDEQKLKIKVRFYFSSRFL